MTSKVKEFDAFISYAKEDVASAQRRVGELRLAGFNVWFDLEQLLPGQTWQAEIEAAIPRCLTFVALLSASSVSKVGYVQRELKVALNVIDTVPENVPFVIPVRLDISEPADSRLRAIQWLDLFEGWERSVERLAASIRLARQLRGRSDESDVTKALIMIKLEVIDGALPVIQSVRSRSEIEQLWFCEGEHDLIALVDVPTLDALLSLVDWINTQNGIANTHIQLLLDTDS